MLRGPRNAQTVELQKTTVAALGVPFEDYNTAFHKGLYVLNGSLTFMTQVNQ